MEDNYDSWIQHLNPENLKGNLMGSSLYVSIYESLVDYVVDQVKYFYHTGFDEKGDQFDPKYNSEVLALDEKNPVNASLKWFIKNNVISDKEYSRFQELRKFRNMLVHEMMSVLFEGLSTKFEDNFSDLVDLRLKIERWWVLEVEIPTNPDFYGNSEINLKDVTTGSEIMFKLISDLLSDDEKTANHYRNEFIKFKQSMK